MIRESSVPSLGEPQASAHRAMLPSVDTSLQGGASIKKKNEKKSDDNRVDDGNCILTGGNILFKGAFHQGAPLCRVYNGD